jgi:hypothetical protein
LVYFFWNIFKFFLGFAFRPINKSGESGTLVFYFQKPRMLPGRLVNPESAHHAKEVFFPAAR